MSLTPAALSRPTSSCIRLAALPVLFAGLLAPVAARAQVTYSGSTATQNFGSVAIG